MGCIWSKVFSVEDSHEVSKINSASNKYFSELHVSSDYSSKIIEEIKQKRKLDRREGPVAPYDKKNSGSVYLNGEQIERNNTQVSASNHPCAGRIPRAAEAEQIAAGWPAWLATSACEALEGWIPRQSNTFEKLNKIGQGTYSNVYRARDVREKKTVALKRIRFDNHDTESIKFMAREIVVLRHLNHPNIIKLEGIIASQSSCTMYLIFEYMEHDLTGLSACPGVKFSEPQVKCYMQQLLSGLDHCHSRGILHRDIKGSNLLIDNNGMLKIADFGLAIFFDPQKAVQMTSRVITLWYRPPELLLGASQYGVGVDLWSTGCILGELYAGKPILPGKTEVEQLHKIFKLCGSPPDDYWNKLKSRHSTAMKPLTTYLRCLRDSFKDFPTPVLTLMDTLLSVDPAERGTAAEALKSEFFTTSPLACDPSSLPKYSPSKEIDAKLWEAEARRKGVLGMKGRVVELERRGQKVPGDVKAAELANLMQKLREGQPNSKMQNGMNRPRGQVVSPFPAGRQAGFSHSEPIIHVPICAKSRYESRDAFKDSSNFSSKLAETDQAIPHRSSAKPTDQVTEAMNAQAGRNQERIHRRDRKIGDDNAGDEIACIKEPSLHGRGPKGNHIYVSESFLVTSSNVDRMFKVHDCRIREYSRQARVEKGKLEKTYNEGRKSAKPPPCVYNPEG